MPLCKTVLLLPTLPLPRPGSSVLLSQARPVSEYFMSVEPESSTVFIGRLPLRIIIFRFLGADAKVSVAKIY